MGSSKTVETPNPFATIFRRLRRSFDKCQILLIIIIILLCKIISDIQEQNTKKIEELAHSKRHSKNAPVPVEPNAAIEDEPGKILRGSLEKFNFIFAHKFIDIFFSICKALG